MYADENWNVLACAHMACLLWVQAWGVPGSFAFNVIGGALFGNHHESSLHYYRADLHTFLDKYISMCFDLHFFLLGLGLRRCKIWVVAVYGWKYDRILSSLFELSLLREEYCFSVLDATS